MRLIFLNIKESPINIMRRIGYGFLRRDDQSGELSFTKRAGGADYPRFHVYLKVVNNKVEINLHLDQKKASYKGSAAHGGEYGGELLEKETKNIQRGFWE